MENIINLYNDCYLKIMSNTSKVLIEEIIDIKDLSLINVLRRKRFLLKIDFKEMQEKQYKRVLKILLFIKNINIEIGINDNGKKLVGYVFNYDNTNRNHNDFISAINAIFCDTRYERYNYIYDTVCNYLDKCFYGKNLCDFKDNKCGEKVGTFSTTGCCHHFKHKWLGPFSKLVLCEYLKEDYSCSAQCISCKLFTCNYLEKKGIKFKIKDFLLLDVFFNPLQKYFIKYMVFTPKDKIIKRLLAL